MRHNRPQVPPAAPFGKAELVDFGSARRATDGPGDLREVRRLASAEEIADYETDLLAGFVLARASAGLSDGTIRGEVSNLEQVREWLGRPLWEMEAADADAYFGKVMRRAASGTRHARAGAP